MDDLCLCIVNWDGFYENHRTREMPRMDWVPLPNKMDGDGYTELVCDHENGPAHYAAWVAMLLMASRCTPRGYLVRDRRAIPREARAKTANFRANTAQFRAGARSPSDDAQNSAEDAPTDAVLPPAPHDARSLSRVTRIPEEIFAEAIPRLVEIGWVCYASVPNPLATQEMRFSAQTPRETRELPRKTGASPREARAFPRTTAHRNGTERNGISSSSKADGGGDKWTPDQIEQTKGWMREAAETFTSREWPLPDRTMAGKVLSIFGGSLDEIGIWLREVTALGRQDIRSYGWFETAARNRRGSTDAQAI